MEITDRLSYYEDTYGYETDNDRDDDEVIRGVALTSKLKDVEKFQDIDTRVPLEWVDSHFKAANSPRVIAVPNYIYEEVMNGELCITDITSGVSNPKCYDPENYKYCIWCHSIKVLADLDGNALRAPFWYSYNNSHVTSEFFNLEEAVEFMKSDSRFLPARFTGEDEICIKKVPWMYNISNDNSADIVEFLYVPTSSEESQQLKLIGAYGRQQFIWKVLKDFRK